jgi:hypothetical protein
MAQGRCTLIQAESSFTTLEAAVKETLISYAFTLETAVATVESVDATSRVAWHVATFSRESRMPSQGSGHSIHKFRESMVYNKLF